MDSLSQIVLGAAVGELLFGQKIGNRALLIGAIGGTIPDLDVLLNPFFSDEIVKLQIHRGYSHSMFVHMLLALPFAWLTWKWFKKKYSYGKWYLTWYLLFFTHTLLDCCTTYGTQLFLPFTNYLVGFNNIAVIDVFWTIPFMFILMVCLFLRRDSRARRRWAIAAMSYALIYMAYTLVNKFQVHQHFKHEFERQGLTAGELYTSPMMLNNWLWSGIVVNRDTIYVGEYSLLQNEEDVEWVAFPRNLDLMENHPAQHDLEVLKWFGQGKYFVVPEGENLLFYNVKWGRMDFTKTKPDEAIVFHYRLKKSGDKWVTEIVSKEFTSEEFKEALNATIKRVGTSTIE